MSMKLHQIVPVVSNGTGVWLYSTNAQHVRMDLTHLKPLYVQDLFYFLEQLLDF